jgi:hypothetical protein
MVAPSSYIFFEIQGTLTSAEHSQPLPSRTGYWENDQGQPKKFGACAQHRPAQKSHQRLKKMGV